MAEENEVQDEELKASVEGESQVDTDDHEDDEDDERVASEASDSDSDPDEDHESKTERNRKWREERKKRRAEKEESYRRELSARDRVINELNSRLAVVERKSTGSEMAQLENAEQKAISDYNRFKDINAKAIEQANGQVAIAAQEKMFEARQHFEHLQNIKKGMTQRQNAPQPLDPRLVNHAQEWMTKNQWYDPTGKDEDSDMTLKIDSRMANEGWDPTTPEYWTELEKRVKKYLPHRANSGYNRNQVTSRPPVAGSGRESSVSSSKSTYKLSSERVQALKDIGVWDDPKARDEHIKLYRDYDKANGL